MSIEEGLIPLFRLKVLLSGMRLEEKGLKRRGRSCTTLTREYFRWKGTRTQLIEKLENHISRREEDLHLEREEWRDINIHILREDHEEG